MSILPVPQDADVNQDPNETLPDYGYWNLFKESAKSAFSELRASIATNSINTDVTKYNPANVVTAEERQDLLNGRPDLNIPTGINKSIANTLAENYDEQQYYNVVRSHKPGLMGTITAFAGAVPVGLLDVKSDVAAYYGGKLALSAFKPIAGRLLEKLASTDLFGWNAAHIATTLAENTASGAGGFTGYTVSAESTKIQNDLTLGNPHDYIDTLRNIAKSPLYGAALGLFFGGIGIAFFGRRVPLADGTTQRVGGLFNDTSFRDVPDEAKDIINEHYKPWSQASDTVMKEETAGQMANGNFPNLDPILKQGVYDQGEKFRQALKDGKVDIDQLNNALDGADDGVQNRLRDLIEERKQLDETDHGYLESDIEKLNSQDNIDIKEDGIQKLNTTDKLKQENIENKINPDLQLPKEELVKIKNKLLKNNLLVDNSESLPEYKRLKELAENYKQAKTLFDRVEQERQHNQSLLDLANEKMIIDNMRGQVNNTHPAATPDDVESYANHVRSSRIPESGEKIPDAKDVDIEEHIDDVINNEFANLVQDIPKELREEFDSINKAIDNLPDYEQMVKQTTECIVKGLL